MGIKIENISKIFDNYFGKEYLIYDELEYADVKQPNAVKNIAILYQCMSVGGVERVISLQIIEFMKLGYKVTLILEEGNEDSIDYKIPNSVKILFIPGMSQVLRTKSYTLREEKLNEIIVNEKIDMLCHHCSASNIVFYDLLTFKKNNVYTILIHHELFSQEITKLSVSPYRQKYIDRLADRIVVLSEMEQLYYKIFGIKAVYIPDPLGDYAVTSKAYNFKGDIVWVGRLYNNQKQYMDIVPIMKEVTNVLPNVKIRVYGPEWPTDIAGQLENSAKENGLENNIIYCGNVIGDTSKMYEDVSIHLVTSAYESFGMAIAESKMNGIPLVTYKMPYLELLKDGKGYIAVENDDTGAAAEAIVNILTNHNLAKRLSRESKQSIQKFINFDYGEAWHKLIKGLTDNGQFNDDMQIDVKSLEIIFDTMGYHYYKGLSYMKERLNEVRRGERRQYIKCLLQIKLHNNEHGIVIYPYGKWGKEIKDILNNDLNIHEAFIVDNKLSKIYKEIKSLNDMDDIDCRQYQFLLCCTNEDIHDELLSLLKEYVPNENIVDVFG
jgi:glycosyltransferase involved in cell wall biosynthesis